MRLWGENAKCGQRNESCCSSRKLRSRYWQVFAKISDSNHRRPGSGSEIEMEKPLPLSLKPLESAGFSISFFVRMLFSCLVDADYLDTEAFVTDGAMERGGYDGIETLRTRLMEHLQSRFYPPKNELNRKRCDILEACIREASSAPGLYSLTVPTGGGKTLASQAFALEHAKIHGLRRVIYVISYTSIVEQTAEKFAEVLGAPNVLEHHSGAEYDNEEEQSRRHLAAENWDAPVIVTTNVQFFESLFAARTSRCRKLHNIVGSAIIFDEAQMLPLKYLKPCVRAIAELCHNYGCTAMLCSATQPALDGLFPKQIKRTEIMRDLATLYEFFRRTHIVDIGAQDDEALAQRLRFHTQALCIVRTRKQAQNLYRLMED